MRFKQNASVSTADGQEVGHIDRVVIDPKTKEVTHVVVRAGFLFTDDRVVPIELVAEATEDRLDLREYADDLHNLPKFEETHYVRAPEDENGRSAPVSGGFAGSLYSSVPVTTYAEPESGPRFVRQVAKNIPEGTVALRQGAKVLTEDGKLAGHVEEVLTDPETEQATHILVSKGLLAKERRLVPGSWVRKIEENEIHLAVPANFYELLRLYKD